MRSRSLSTVFFVVVVISAGLVGAVPSLRDATRNALSRDARERRFLALTATDVLELAESRPTDEAVWLLACRGLPGHGKVVPASLARAYARAVALDPTDPAPHWFYAAQLMQSIPFDRDELYALYPDYRRGGQKSTRLSAGQEAAAARADLALRRAGQLDPQNAAVDYFRAYLALAEHEDIAAMGLLRSGLGKPRWNEYGRIAAAAALDTLRPLLPATTAWTYVIRTSWDAPASEMEKHLERVLTGMSILAARRHHDERAIFLREAVDHLGRLMIRDAYQIMDAKVGLIIWAEGATWDPTQPVPSAARSQADVGSELYPGAALAVYLREHGRAELAKGYESFGKQMRPTAAELDRVKDLERKQKAQAARADLLGTILSHVSSAQLPTLGLLLLFALAALLLRVSRRPVRPLEQSRRGWLLLVSTSLLLVFVVGLIWPGESPSVIASRQIAKQVAEAFGKHFEPTPSNVRPSLADRPWGYYFAVVGLPALLVLTWGVALVHRHRRGAQVGCSSHYVGTVLCLLLPLGAFLSLALLTVAVPAARETGRQLKMEQAVIHQGEVAYYGLRLP